MDPTPLIPQAIELKESFPRPSTMSPNQYFWKYLVNTLGESKARAYVAARLREAAHLVETSDYPDVFSCVVPIVEGPIAGSTTMDRLSITFSHPWGG